MLIKSLSSLALLPVVGKQFAADRVIYELEYPHPLTDAWVEAAKDNWSGVTIETCLSCDFKKGDILQWGHDTFIIKDIGSGQLVVEQITGENYE